MKKVLVIMLALALAAPAFAITVADTKHNLVGKGTLADDNGEICAYCHTPHGGSSTAAAPLWNRTVAGDSDMTALCMSCHSGTVTGADDINPPGASTGMTGTYTYSATGTATSLGGVDHPSGAGVNMAALNVANGLVFAAPVVPASTPLDASGNVVCTSCHNVHDYTNMPFLQISNAGSAMCVNCHVQ